MKHDIYDYISKLVPDNLKARINELYKKGFITTKKFNETVESENRRLWNKTVFDGHIAERIFNKFNFEEPKLLFKGYAPDIVKDEINLDPTGKGALASAMYRSAALKEGMDCHDTASGNQSGFDGVIVVQGHSTYDGILQHDPTVGTLPHTTLLVADIKTCAIGSIVTLRKVDEQIYTYLRTIIPNWDFKAKDILNMVKGGIKQYTNKTKLSPKITTQEHETFLDCPGYISEHGVNFYNRKWNFFDEPAVADADATAPAVADAVAAPVADAAAAPAVAAPVADAAAAPAAAAPDLSDDLSPIIPHNMDEPENMKNNPWNTRKNRSGFASIYYKHKKFPLCVGGILNIKSATITKKQLFDHALSLGITNALLIDFGCAEISGSRNRFFPQTLGGKLNKRKTKKRTVTKTNKRKTNRRKNKRKTNKQRGGNFSAEELEKLTTLLKRIGFTDVELGNCISKMNNLSQHLTSGNGFDTFISFIDENYEYDKQGLITWVNDKHTEQMQLSPKTDNEDSDDE